MRPIFRDREELSAAADLGETIRDALDRSDSLILLCSPTAAASLWVDREVAYFLKGRGPGDVLCVITPATADDATLTDVMPPSLLAALPEGVEPLAVDLRRDADGKRLARLKLAARLLGVSLDQLVQRDARRRLRVMAAFTTVAALVTLGMGAMTIATLKSRQIAREQRDETEALVAYMLGDLRQQLEPVGRLDVLDGVSAKVLAYYGKARTDRMDDKALSQRAKAQTLLGTIREQRGDLAGAQDAFGQAAATTHALVERDPNNGDRIFDEAQNVFWLAYMEWRRGDAAGAERGFKHYAELAQTLVKLDPKRPDWRVEVAYANNNLGMLLFEQGRSDEALAAFGRALTIFDAERMRTPTDIKRLGDVANTRAWMADTLLSAARPLEALTQRQAAAKLLADAEVMAPKDQRLAAKSVSGQLALARLELDVGHVADARAHADAGLGRLRQLAALDPTNARWAEYLTVGLLDEVDIALWSDPAAAPAAHAAATAALAKLRSGNTGWRPDLEGRLTRQAIMLAERARDAGKARDLAAELIKIIPTAPGTRDAAVSLASLEGFARLTMAQPRQAISALSPQRRALQPASRDILARAYLALGEREKASAIVNSLTKAGYQHPAFLAFWGNSPVGGKASQ